MELSKEQVVEYRSRLLRTMEAFMAFCKENGLQYFTAYGSAIGAVRHKGLIPWDDDIDVYMPRADYERFIVMQASAGYEILSARTTYEKILAGADMDAEGEERNVTCIPFTHAKFCERNSTIWERQRYPYLCGTFVDVFPLDSIENDEAKVKAARKQYWKAFIHYKRSFRRHHPGDWFSDLFHANFREVLSAVKDVLRYRLFHRRYFKAFCEADKALAGRQGDCYHVIGSMWDWQHPHPKSDFDGIVEADFEDIKVALPKGNDAVLRRIYGDYMELPSVNKRVSHHYHYFVDLDHRFGFDEIRERM